MGLGGAFFVYLSLVIAGYVSHADIDEDKRNLVLVALVILWLIIIVISFL